MRFLQTIEKTQPNKSIQEADDEADNYEENAAGASFDEMSTDAPTDSPDKTDNRTSAGETVSDTISEEKDSEISAGEAASDTISEEKDSEILAEEKDSEIFAGETTSGAVSEANSAEIDQADTARTEEVSGENINADPYVPALEPVDFNTVLTSSILQLLCMCDAKSCDGFMHGGLRTLFWIRLIVAVLCA